VCCEEWGEKGEAGRKKKDRQRAAAGAGTHRTLLRRVAWLGFLKREGVRQLANGWMPFILI
jgi:hypothetical protein